MGLHLFTMDFWSIWEEVIDFLLTAEVIDFLLKLKKNVVLKY